MKVETISYTVRASEGLPAIRWTLEVYMIGGVRRYSLERSEGSDEPPRVWVEDSSDFDDVRFALGCDTRSSKIRARIIRKFENS